MLKSPLISIIMPVYNTAGFLDEAITSILNQTIKDFELIIIDDCSTDNSLEIIKIKQQEDHRIIVIEKNVNEGPAVLRNQGIDLAKGFFIALMDADDISNQERFEKQLNIFSRNPEIGVCGTWFTIFGKNTVSEVIKHYEFHEKLKVEFLKDCYIGNPTAMIKASILKKYKYKKEFVPMEDYELWSRLIHETQFYNIQESLLNYRWHETNISQTKSINLEKIHKTIRLNQLKEFIINKTNTESDFFLQAIEFKKPQSPKNILEIISCGEYLISQNKILKIYSLPFFEERINKTLSIQIKNSENYNFAFLRKINKSNYFNLLSWTKRLKITIKSYLNWVNKN